MLPMATPVELSHVVSCLRCTQPGATSRFTAALI
jgi:hypothetical protein